MRLLNLSRASLPLAVLVAVALLLTSCDSGGSNNGGDGQSAFDNAFSLTVTDSTGASKQFDSFAYFATGKDPNTGIEGFVLYFLDEDSFSQNTASSGLFGIAVRNGGRPGPGKLAVSDDDTAFDNGSALSFVLYDNLGAQNSTIYSGATGELTVTRSDANRVDASLDVDAKALSIATGTETSVTIQGSFRAKFVNTFFGTGFLNP